MDSVSRVLSIEFAKRRIRLGREFLHLTKRFFELYCLLAVMRVQDPNRNGGYVECEQINQLPSWRKNLPLSVGKQISRHAVLMADRGVSLIAAEQKVQGPFRLELPPAAIQLDVDVSVVINQLALPIVGAAAAVRNDRWHFEFAERYWRAVNSFHDGDLGKALGLFQEALSLKPPPVKWLAAGFYIQRILERHDQLEEAESLASKSENYLRQAGRYWRWAKARNLVLSAWRAYREEELEKATELYREALVLSEGHGLFQVPGDVHNGLGGIAKEQGRYTEALGHYLEALDAWLASEYFYGLQAIYFNVAVLYRSWGDHFEQFGHHAAAKEKYQLAVEWAEGCTRLCTLMGLGFDTSEAESLLSSLHLKLGQKNNAVKAALEAQRIALRSRNARSIALASRTLAAAYLAKGDETRVVEILKSCADWISPRNLKLLLGGFRKRGK